jgi:hypothetical protein
VNVDNDHKCFILKNSEEKLIEIGGYIFFDYECMQVDDSNHVPNLIVTSRLCNECIFHTDICDKSECKKFCFKTNEEFGTWLFTTKNKNYIAIAHNMKSYDGSFLTELIIKNILPTDNVPEILLNGSKLLVIMFMGINIIDSINFIPMPLF